MIRTGPEGRCIASWRRPVLLPRGKYRLTGRVKLAKVTALADEKGSGAGLRISGENRPAGLEGTADSKDVEFRFEVAEDVREVVLVAELRATAGEVRFDAHAMKLVRLPEE